MKFEQILQSIELQKFASVYLLYGEETFYMDQIVEHLQEHVLSPEQKAFNLHILYGKDTEAVQILDYARRFPVMADRQLIILREAQEMKEKLLDLAPYCEKPVPSTILAIVHSHKSPSKRSSFYKSIKKTGLVFEAKKPYQNQVPAWIDQYLRTKGFTIKPAACQIIAEYLGTDLQKVANELDKICINLEQDAVITPDHIESGIGISREYNVFELQKAIGWKERERSFRIVDSMQHNMKQNPLQMVTVSLFSYFLKIYLLKSAGRIARSQQAKLMGLRNEYFLNEYLKAAGLYSIRELEHVFLLIHTYELKSKGIESGHSPQGELFRELVYRILN